MACFLSYLSADKFMVERRFNWIHLVISGFTRTTFKDLCWFYGDDLLFSNPVSLARFPNYLLPIPPCCWWWFVLPETCSHWTQDSSNYIWYEWMGWDRMRNSLNEYVQSVLCDSKIYGAYLKLNERIKLQVFVK